MCILLTLGVPAAASDPAAQSSPAWWSFQPLTLPEVPPAQISPAAWSEHPIDRFILAKLEANGLAPSPPADRRTLIRRVTYDLTGLPPTPGEISDFVKDTRNDAYERVVDRLLASPRYGEQWGRHWLDAIRFGESRGFERNEIINTAWPFRDYVIRSFNEDKPFDRLVLEHLAGDVIGAGNPDVAIGSAFLVAGPYDDVGNQDPVQARVIRANTVDEIITAVGSAFLGITVHCARCHDHKFDPVTAEDYYRFQSVFSGVRHGERALESPEERRAREARLAPLEARRKAALEALSSFEAGVLEQAPAGDDADPESHLPPVHPHLTEDVFEPVEAKQVRLSIRSNNRNPRDAGGVRIDELEVWTEGDTPRNVALADAGAVATGPSRQAEDFADAYAVPLVNDGRYGARWIVDGPAQLVVTFPEIERVRRVAFSADRMKALPPDSGEIVFVGEYRIEVSVDGTNWIRVADSMERPPLNESFARERRLTAALTPEDIQERARLHGELRAIEAEIRKVPPPRMVWAGRFEQPGAAAYVMLGGDPERKGAEVGAGSLSALDGVVEGFQLPKDAPESERRVALAKWLVDPDNPLTARVIANRVWHHHFGTGLVDTPGDFGELGGQPSHAELLDWLALQLQQHGWRLKPLHREMVLSRTYRQSSAWRETAAAIDAEGRLLWRFPPRRLTAEQIRDTLLSVAGVLDTRMGGPGFRLYRYLQDNVATYLPLEEHGPDTRRRAVYHQNARATRVDLLTDFDAPDCSFPAPDRSTTTSPLQALTLLNHSFTLDMAEALARRLEHDCPAGGVEARIGRAFQLAFGREPDAMESEAGIALAREHGLPAFCRALLNANELVYVE